MKIYFAGKVPKGDEAGTASDWRAELATALQQTEASIEMISPENTTLDESDALAVFGHDCLLIQSADLVIVNADQKLGVGTAQEMIIAKYFGKPVLTILPKDTHHRRSNLNMYGTIIPDWKHPFIVSTSDHIFDSVSAIATSIGDRSFYSIISSPSHIGIIDKAIEHYGSLYRTHTK
jgi:nucleoside 2-deoxyribosyltransferase